MPRLSVLLAASLWCITLLGGCPAAQQPTVPQQDEPPAQDTPSTPDDDLNRPIDQPELDGDSPDGGSGSPSDPVTPSGGGGGDSGQSSPIIITMQQPADPLAVRPGTIVNIEFSLLDLAGAVESGELLVARDNDADGVPDGGSLIPKFPITMSSESSNVIAFNTNLATGLLTNGFGRFVVGVKAVTIDKKSTSVYNPATITIDAIPPTASWVGAGSPPTIPLDKDDHLVNRGGTWTFRVNTTDNSPHTVRVQLDTDLNPSNSNEYELVAATAVPAGTAARSFSAGLAAFPPGTYHYLVTVSDGIAPAVVFYADNPTTDLPARLAVTNRLIGEFQLEQLTDSNHGAIMQGFNFGDLAGSSMASVPDLDGDGDSELIIASRFGKANLASVSGIGVGEAYMIYGNQSQRLRRENSLNSVGGGSISGLTFRGIRNPVNTTYTEGLADFAVVDDMDGDNLAELVFSFPRTESLNLSAPAFAGSTPFQHPELLADEPGMGALEYDAIDYMGEAWIPNLSQFTRGGIVIVSSHNQMLAEADTVTRKFDRVLDLHEVGQMFDFMGKGSLAKYVRKIVPADPFQYCADCIPGETGDCGGDPENEAETEVTSWIVEWDTWLGGG